MAGVTLGTQFWAIYNKIENWQTMVFTILALSQLGHVLAVRSERTFLYKQGIFSNLPLLSAVLLTFVLQMAVVYLPFMNNIFKTHPLTIVELIITLAMSAVVFTRSSWKNGSKSDSLKNKQYERFKTILRLPCPKSERAENAVIGCGIFSRKSPVWDSVQLRDFTQLKTFGSRIIIGRIGNQETCNRNISANKNFVCNDFARRLKQLLQKYCLINYSVVNFISSLKHLPKTL